jgi:hypothetical protein
MLVVDYRFHAGHDEFPAFVIGIPEDLNGALTTSPNGAQGWMPTEIRQVKP